MFRVIAAVGSTGVRRKDRPLILRASVILRERICSRLRASVSSYGLPIAKSCDDRQISGRVLRLSELARRLRCAVGMRNEMVTTTVLERPASPSLNPLRVSLAQAQEILGLSKTTFYKRVAEGKIRIHKDGARSFMRVEDLQSYVDACAGDGDEDVT